ncbi:DUF803-domain-containing protein [Xylona heveae TC161]|uniref:DUF803-domain-containing protein n=1 Tax=Xylona heveae (strain CBS 132557 / TC161) TaxID=1328760 RepID=A0A165FVQ6_XYLHT|nr:DUF803-domain-containing protein [Xylona heveae TC161]KZF21438.1 DUF803-domain-containing protein [Xylona heveae TC161]
MDICADILSSAHTLHTRSSANADTAGRPPVYKAIGISLAVASGLFIGSSFVLKKIGLLKSNVKYDQEAGEGYGYLKNAWWWAGMILMIIGEVCNFVAYAFVDAILVTPFGALSVVITTILSAIFLKERLSFVGKVGCFSCIIGSVVIAINAPEQSSAADIQEMKHYVISPGFLSYAGVIIVGCVFVALWAGPRYGKKSMMVYLSICSLIGGLSVVATQGLGAAIVTQIGGTPQFNQWFLYVLLVFVAATLITEIIYLNKALNIFNAALVTPTYYVYFTSSTIVTSAILFRGFKGSALSIVTVVLGFFQICSGVVLLQLSKSAKDVPDAAVFTGDLDQVRTVAEQEQPESEPKADAIRGASAIVRRFSQSRQKKELEEAKRVQSDRMHDLEPIGENEQVEWDGIRRRKTIRSGPGSLHRTKTRHPPLGLTYFPDETEDERRPESQSTDRSFFGQFRRKTSTMPTFGNAKVDLDSRSSSLHNPNYVPLSEISVTPTQIRWASGVDEKPHLTASSGTEHDSNSLAPNPPPHGAKRQFSFQKVFHRHRSDDGYSENDGHRPSSALGFGNRGRHSRDQSESMMRNATEEERLGLVKGDSKNLLAEDDLYHDGEEQHDIMSDRTSSDEDWHQLGGYPSNIAGRAHIPVLDDNEDTESTGYGATRTVGNVEPISNLDHRGSGTSRGSDPSSSVATRDLILPRVAVEGRDIDLHSDESFGHERASSDSHDLSETQGPSRHQSTRSASDWEDRRSDTGAFI